ncbi:MAG: MMPL family transporter [Gemmataceae bacterium]|nr:MMPL family transporter [Gemmataceae bacterium]
MYRWLGRFAANHPWLICCAWLLMGVSATWFAPSWDKNSQDDDIRFLPARCDSVRGYHLLEEAFPGDIFASKAVFLVERKSGPLEALDYSFLDRAVTALRKLAVAEPNLQIGKILYEKDPIIGKKLVSENKSCSLVQVFLATPYMANQTRQTVDRVEKVFRENFPTEVNGPVRVMVTGLAAVGRDLVSAGGSSLESTTVATILLVIVTLLFVYRAPGLALIPLVTIAWAVWIALEFLALCTLIPGFQLMNISRIFAVVMLYGAGTDYCLFLISRYREELENGLSRSDALVMALEKVGGAITASAGTVICGMGLMILAEFAKVRCGGPAIAMGLFVALLASITLAPALLAIFGKVAFWPGKVTCKSPFQDRQTLWGRFGNLIVSRPITSLLVVTAVLTPLAVLGLQISPSYRATGELSQRSQSILGMKSIQEHFIPGELGPVIILLESNRPWDDLEGKQILSHLSKGFLNLPHVAEVRSFTQPLGTPVKNPKGLHEDPQGILKNIWANIVQGVDEQIMRQAREYYLAHLVNRDNRDRAQLRHVTRLEVVLDLDPFAPSSQPTMEKLKYWAREQLPWSVSKERIVNAEFYGVTASAQDMATVTEADRARINILVLTGIFLILLYLVRNPWIAGYLLATVLFSYLATLGATSLVANWYDGRPIGELDWRVPFFLFIILVAVGADYNILLITRMMQERKELGAIEGTKKALAMTGGTITSCGLIMAGTFATLMLSGLNTLFQIGFALAFGVILDTFVVRPILVPAFTVWLWSQEEKGEEEVAPGEESEIQSLPKYRSRFRKAI